MHKTNLLHASHLTGHEWVKRRKRKWVVLEELVELQPDLKFIKPDGSVDDKKWKVDHRVSSGTYNMLLYQPRKQYFSKRLMNKGKMKRASKFHEKFPVVLSFFQNFLQTKANLRPCTRHIRLKAQDFVSLSFLRECSYVEESPLSFGIMDLRNAPTTADQDANLRDPAIFTYIHRMKRMSKLAFNNPCIWLWIHSSEERLG